MRRLLGLSLAILFLTTAARAEPTCRQPSGSELLWLGIDSGQQMGYEGDLDGDQVDDTVHGHRSWGSGGDTVWLEVTLSTSRAPIRIQLDGSYDRMVSRYPIPAGLRAPKRRRAREFVEGVLFGEVCDSPDPSLAALLGNKPKWTPGRPALPRSYAVAIGNHWVEYLGANHARTGDGQLTVAPRCQPQAAGWSLCLTAHGAYLDDPGHDRFAWLYVFPGAPGHKLRAPSVTAGRIARSFAVLTVSGSAGVVTTVRAAIPAQQPRRR